MTTRFTPLKCPHCGMNTLKNISESREHGDWIRRRRTCTNCGKRATTFEMVAATTKSMKVIGSIRRGRIRDGIPYRDMAGDPDYPNLLVTFP